MTIAAAETWPPSWVPWLLIAIVGLWVAWAAWRRAVHNTRRCPNCGARTLVGFECRSCGHNPYAR